MILKDQFQTKPYLPQRHFGVCKAHHRSNVHGYILPNRLGAILRLQRHCDIDFKEDKMDIKQYYF